MRINAQEIREASRARLADEGVPTRDALPLFGRAVAPRSSGQVADRVVALYALVGLAHDADPGKLIRWLEGARCDKALTGEERGLFQKERVSHDEEKRLSWLQEALYLLMWAGSLVGELRPAQGECDLDALLPLIPPEVSVADFRRSVAIRPPSELLVEADYLYQLHWAIRHPEVWHREEEHQKFSRDVVIERRRAIEWSLNRRLAWWDISLDT